MALQPQGSASPGSLHPWHKNHILYLPYILNSRVRLFSLLLFSNVNHRLWERRYVYVIRAFAVAISTAQLKGSFIFETKWILKSLKRNDQRTVEVQKTVNPLNWFWQVNCVCANWMGLETPREKKLFTSIVTQKSRPHSLLQAFRWWGAN